jgi:hypothetical protein
MTALFLHCDPASKGKGFFFGLLRFHQSWTKREMRIAKTATHRGAGLRRVVCGA